MSSRIFPYYRIFMSIIVIVLVLVVLKYIFNDEESLSEELPILGTVSPFEFVNQDNKSFGHLQLNGKISVVDFIFTRCKGPCPVMADHMSQLYNIYRYNPHIQFISISVEPDYDSVTVLKKYATKQGVTDIRWIFLRGDIEEVVALSEESFMLSADDLPGMHSTKFVLVDQERNIRAYYDGTGSLTVKIIQKSISQLLEEE
ncbi:SCO family protein [Candidatus Zixiibacteriota bacterium]